MFSLSKRLLTWGSTSTTATTPAPDLDPIAKKISDSNLLDLPTKAEIIAMGDPKALFERYFKPFFDLKRRENISVRERKFFTPKTFPFLDSLLLTIDAGEEGFVTREAFLNFISSFAVYFVFTGKLNLRAVLHIKTATKKQGDSRRLMHILFYDWPGNDTSCNGGIGKIGPIRALICDYVGTAIENNPKENTKDNANTNANTIPRMQVTLQLACFNIEWSEDSLVRIKPMIAIPNTVACFPINEFNLTEECIKSVCQTLVDFNKKKIYTPDATHLLSYKNPNNEVGTFDFARAVMEGLEINWPFPEGLTIQRFIKRLLKPELVSELLTSSSFEDPVNCVTYRFSTHEELDDHIRRMLNHKPYPTISAGDKNPDWFCYKAFDRAFWVKNHFKLHCRKRDNNCRDGVCNCCPFRRCDNPNTGHTNAEPPNQASIDASKFSFPSKGTMELIDPSDYSQPTALQRNK